MEDQSGYSQWSYGAQWLPQDDEEQLRWPCVAYTMRDDLRNLLLHVRLSKVGAKVPQKAPVRAAEEHQELIVRKPADEPLGLIVVDSREGVLVSGTEVGSIAEHQKLNRFRGCILTYVNGFHVLSAQDAVDIMTDTGNLRLHLSKAGELPPTAVETEENLVTVSWQQKLHHPEELIAIMQRDAADAQKQELLMYLDRYEVMRPQRKGPGSEQQRIANETAEELRMTLPQAQELFTRCDRGGGVVLQGDVAALIQADASLWEIVQASQELYAAVAGMQGAPDVPLTWDAFKSSLNVSLQRPTGGGGDGEFLNTVQEKFEHLLSSTRICTFVNGDNEALYEHVLSEPVTTGEPYLTQDKIDSLKQRVQPPVESGMPVVKWQAKAKAAPAEKNDQLDQLQLAPKKEEMWIVAAFGGLVKRTDGSYSWVTRRNVVLAHLEATSKTSFKIWPPLSDLGAVVAQRRRQEDVDRSAKAVAQHIPKPLPPSAAEKPYVFKVPVSAKLEKEWVYYNYSVGIKELQDLTSAEGERSEDGRSEASASQLPDKGIEEIRKEMLHRVIGAYQRQLQAARREQSDGAGAGPFTTVPGIAESRVHFFGDIMSARGFECPNLFIRFEIILPKSRDWRIDSHTTAPSTEKLVYFTQTSAVSRQKSPEGVWRTFFAFAMPFELQFVASLGSNHPRMLLEAHSERTCGQHELEGYAFVDLAPSPGSHRTKVRCWKPIHSVRENLREFFLGMSSVLDDRTFTALPDSFNQSFVNKFGFHAHTTGEIEVRWNCALQSSDPWIANKLPVPFGAVDSSVAAPWWKTQRSHSVV